MISRIWTFYDLLVLVHLNFVWQLRRSWGGKCVVETLTTQGWSLGALVFIKPHVLCEYPSSYQHLHTNGTDTDTHRCTKDFLIRYVVW